MKSKLIIVLLCVLILAGCATLKSTTGGACKELTKATEKLNKAIIIARVAHEQDPNIVTSDNIRELIVLHDSIQSLAGTACVLNSLVPDKVK